MLLNLVQCSFALSFSGRKAWNALNALDVPHAVDAAAAAANDASTIDVNAAGDPSVVPYLGGMKPDIVQTLLEW